MKTEKNRHLFGVYPSLILCAALIMGLAACNIQEQGLTMTSQTSPTVPTISTATTDWFPATATPTLPFTPPPATAMPTAPPPTGGSPIFQDDFTHKGLWAAGQFPAGVIAYGNGELSLAISQPGGTLISTRTEPVLTDFYLEITATPTLCLGRDNFGIQFRMATSKDFYRYYLTCSGQVRLERLKAGVGQVLHDWSASAQALPNTSGAYKLGIWARGNELRLYLKDVLQFTVNDASLSSGSLGLYARSMGDTAVTVSFSNLSVYQPNPTP